MFRPDDEFNSQLFFAALVLLALVSAAFLGIIFGLYYE